MRSLILAGTALLAFGAIAAMPIHAEERGNATYVGGGRYTCADRTVGCAIVRQNNDRISQEQIDRRQREQRESRYVNPDPTFSYPRDYSGANPDDWHPASHDRSRGGRK